MRTLVEQIERSLGTGAYYLSLFGALSIPDIAGALSSESGEASGKKYAEWYDAWARPRFTEAVLAALPEHARPYIKDMKSPLSGDDCYRFRCALLREGNSQHPKSPYSRIIFIEPSATTNVIHYRQLNDALCVDIILFCREVTSGARLWLQAAETMPLYQKNHERFASRHANGLSPYIGGVPVIG